MDELHHSCLHMPNSDAYNVNSILSKIFIFLDRALDFKAAFYDK